MKSLRLVPAWIFLVTCTALANAALAITLFQQASTPTMLSLNPQQDSSIAAAGQSFQPPANQVDGIQSTIEGGDARVTLVANFLKRHDSPLQPYDDWGRKLVAIADKYQLDYRLLPSIAMQESNLCKHIPEGTHNCLGFGITGTSTLSFDTYENSFDRAAKTLKEKYIDEGLTTPLQIMRKYTPPSDGSWQASVNQWLTEMNYDDHDKGLALKKNTDLTEYAQPAVAGVATSSGEVSSVDTANTTDQASPTPTATPTEMGKLNAMPASVQ